MEGVFDRRGVPRQAAANDVSIQGVSAMHGLFLCVSLKWRYTHRFIPDYTEGAELVDSVLDVVRKEAEGTDCLQGKLMSLSSRPRALLMVLVSRFPNHPLPRWRNWCWHGYPSDFEDPRGIPRQDDVHILRRPQS
jgi:hypothetical protein